MLPNVDTYSPIFLGKMQQWFLRIYADWLQYRISFEKYSRYHHQAGWYRKVFLFLYGIEKHFF